MGIRESSRSAPNSRGAYAPIPPSPCALSSSSTLSIAVGCSSWGGHVIELLVACRHGKRAAARARLAPLYAWFTEGFATRDLIEA